MKMKTIIKNVLIGKLFVKNYNWWVELETGKQYRIYYFKVFNSSDWYINFKNKRYGVNLDTENMTAKIELEREF